MFGDRDLQQAWLRAFASMPLAGPLAAFVAGVLTVGGELWPALVCVGVVALCIAVEPAVKVSPVGLRRRLLLPVLFFAVGVADGMLSGNSDVKPEMISQSRMIYSGRATAAGPTGSGQRVTATLRADSAGAPEFKAVVFLQFVDPEIEPMSDLRFEASMRQVTVIKDVDDEIDPSEWLLREGIVGQCFIQTPCDLEATPSAASQLAGSFAAAGRQMAETIDRSHLSAFTQNILKAFLTGDKDAVDNATRERFSASGLAHLLAISGAHVGVIAVIAAIALFPLAFWGMRRWIGAMSLLPVWAFVMVSGCQPSAVRAAVMASVFVACRLFQRQPSAGNSLLLSALVILVASPSELTNIGFQLSFAAVAAILAFADRLNPFARTGGMAGFLGSGLAVTLSATIGTALISAYYFHSLPVYFLLSNVAVTLIVPWIIALGLLMLALGALGIPYGAIEAALDILGRGMELTVDAIASLPGATVDGLYFSPALFAVYGLALTALWSWMNARKARRRCATVFLLLSAVGTGVAVAGRADRTPEWIVGRSGDSVEIIVNDGQTLSVYTSATDAAWPEESRRIAMRYRRYMERRGLDGPVRLSADTTRRLEGDTKRGMVVVGSDTIFVVDRTTRESDIPRHARYTIFGRDIHEPQVKFYGAISTDTMLTFGRGEHVATTPHVSLSDGPWRRPLVQTPATPISSAPRLK